MKIRFNEDVDCNYPEFDEAQTNEIHGRIFYYYE